MVIKRFWKLITLTIIIVLILVTYFVHTSIVIANQFPKLELKTISGNEESIRNVQIKGDYYEDGGLYSSSLIVSQEGATYMYDQSFFERLTPLFPENEVSKIIESNRNFMRGKMYHPSALFENENYLAYVSAEIADWQANSQPEYFLKVDVLNKQTKDRHAFTLDIPGRENHYNVSVLDVQMIDGELRVVTDIGKYTTSNQYENEITILSIDPASKKYTGDYTISLSDEKDGSWSDIRLLNDTRDIQESVHLLLVEDENQRAPAVKNEGTGEEEIGIETIRRTLHVYNLETQEIQELTLTERQQVEITSDDSGLTGFVDQNNVTIAYTVGDELVVTSFQLKNLKEEVTYRFNLKELEMDNNVIVKIKGNKVYVAEERMDSRHSANIFIADITTGKVMYEGEIVYKENAKEHSSHQFYDMNVY